MRLIPILALGGICSTSFISANAARAADVTQPPADDAGDQALGEIVVTAQRRPELLRDVPISIANLDAEQLRNGDVVKLSDIEYLTPGLRFDSVTNAVQPTIRGIGTSVNAAGGGSNVGIYVDGFYSPDPLTSNFDVLNVNNIEVLKGPQGTLFGRNTTGGAILVTTAEPSTKTGGVAEVDYERFNTQRYKGYFTTGLTDNLAVDVEGQYLSSNGFLTNIIDGNDDIDHSEDWSARIGLKYAPIDGISFLLRYNHSYISNPGDSLADPFVQPSGQVLAYGPLLGSGLYATDPNHVGREPGQFIGFWAKVDNPQLTIKADLGFANFTSYTQYRRDLSKAYNDFDFSAANVFLADLNVKQETVTQEFLLTSKPSEQGFKWTAGAFYYGSQERWDFNSAGALPITPILSNGTNTYSFAGYGDATYQFTRQWSLTAGARYSVDRVTDAWFTTTYPDISVLPNYQSDRLTPRGVLMFKPTDESSAYFSFTKGYKSGLLNVGGDQATPVKPETVDAYELGYKYEAGPVAVDGAVFKYNYKDLQVSSYFGDSAEISNAASSRIYGVDLQTRYKFPIGIAVNLGGAYTKAEYVNFTNAPIYVSCGAACGGFFAEESENITDGPMQRSPEFTADAGATYPLETAIGRLNFSGDFYHTSKYYFDPSAQFEQSRYNTLGLRASWTDLSDRYTIAVYGNNVTDARYRTSYLATNFGVGASWNEPAAWGVSLRAKF